MSRGQEEKAAAVYCHNCGGNIGPQHNFCPGCGSRVRGEEEEKPGNFFAKPVPPESRHVVDEFEARFLELRQRRGQKRPFFGSLRKEPDYRILAAVGVGILTMFMLLFYSMSRILAQLAAKAGGSP